MNGKILLQYLLPHRALSRIVRHATRWKWPPWKNFLIQRVVQRYAVDLSEAEQPDFRMYPHFNAFFTRSLRADARPCDPDPLAVTCPADGRISQAGTIEQGRIFQAKGHDFSVAELLADTNAGDTWNGGRFATVYLSPRDYHRVHMPLAGQLLETVHIPGRIFSVAPFAVAGIPRLFARNERLVCHFQGEHGRFVVVLVGAMLVSGVSTVWDGPVIPPYARRVVRKDFRARDIHLARFALLGNFDMGSTVITLLPTQARLQPLHAEQSVRVGQRLAVFSTSVATPPCDL